MNTPERSYFPFISGDDALQQLTAVIRGEMENYILTYKLSALVLGISGGIDSALCAALLKPICDKLNIPLVGRSIAIETNGQDEIERSLVVGEAFCHEFAFMDLTDTYLVNRKNMIRLDDSLISKLRQGNMKARMRMIILYDLAQLYRGIVISTDNYTEYLTGFWTLHGDVGDYAPVMNLWKTEIYHLAQFLLKECNTTQAKALTSCINAVPVDGLGISNSDCEQLQVENYFEADRLFEQYFVGKNYELEKHPLIKRFKSSEYKRNNPINITRSTLIK